MRTFDNGSWTSKEAAQQAEGFKSVVEKEVEQLMRSKGEYGATDQEIEMHLLRPGNTLRPARVALVKAGVLCDSGRWRHTLAKRKAIVWLHRDHAVEGTPVEEFNKIKRLAHIDMVAAEQLAVRLQERVARERVERGEPPITELDPAEWRLVKREEINGIEFVEHVLRNPPTDASR